MEEAGKALELIEGRGAVGKIVLEMGAALAAPRKGAR